MAAGPCLGRSENTCKSYFFFPSNIKFWSAGLEARAFIGWDISPAPREFFFICICMPKCVGTYLPQLFSTLLTEADVSLIQLVSLQLALGNHLVPPQESCRLQVGCPACPAYPAFIVGSGPLNFSPCTCVASRLPTEPSLQYSTRGLWGRLWLSPSGMLSPALLFVLRGTSTIMQHKFLQSIGDFSSILNPCWFYYQNEWL